MSKIRKMKSIADDEDVGLEVSTGTKSLQDSQQPSWMKDVMKVVLDSRELLSNIVSD